MPSLYVIDLTFLVDLDEVDVHVEKHREFLSRQYAAGVFLASGRKEPRTGGVILATGDRATLDGVLREDPYNRNSVARYTVTEFLPTMTSGEMSAYRHEE